MSNARASIIDLFERGKRPSEIIKLLGIPRRTVYHAIKRYKELGHIGDRPGRGRKCTVTTPRNRAIIKKRIMRNPRRSLRKVAREIGVNRESVRLIAKSDLGLKAFKLRKAQLLSDNAKRMRVERCRALLRLTADNGWRNILFTDEKIFTVEQAHNHQNDRIWSAEFPGTSAIISHRQKPKSVMVWGGICSTGKTPLIFIDEGVKINQEVYRRDILIKTVLPWSKHHFSNQHWVFQQDSAPSHKAKKTQQWCRDHFPSFITAEEWPPYSPDLNPMDYSIWSMLEARACAKPHKSLDALKKSLLEEWNKISADELRQVTENFQKRLKLCITAKGGHFENF